MREELKTICNVIVGLDDDEKKQVMMVLLSSMMYDRYIDSALEVYEGSKEGMSVKHEHRFWKLVNSIPL